MGLKSSNWSCLKVCLKGYTFCFTTYLVRPTTGAQQSHEQAPKNVQTTLKDQSFVKKFKVSLCASLKTCDLQILGNASEVTLVPKNKFFLKILNIVQSFLDCKVSRADGNLT
jgi:hypothetical protein